MSNGLEKFVSQKIARTNPLEGGPVADAQLTKTGRISDTWGGYLSRLLEHYEGSMQPDQAISLLAIDSDDLTDPRVQSDIDEYIDRQVASFKQEAHEELKPEIRRLQTVLAAIQEGWELSDQGAADTEIEDLVEAFDSAEDEFDYTFATVEELDLHDAKLAALVLHREALESGVAIALDELSSVMLSANIVASEDAPSDLGRSWIAALGSVVESVSDELAKLEAKDIYIGRSGFNLMRDVIERSDIEVSERADESLARISPAFDTLTINEHPLIHGLEK